MEGRGEEEGCCGKVSILKGEIDSRWRIQNNGQQEKAQWWGLKEWI